jgi:CRP-like cAMP-binding protein
MMEHSIRIGNRLLAALPLADFHLLAPHLRKVALEPGAVLVRSGDSIEHIYFPLSGMVAFIMEMPNGQTVATAVIGSEGATGIIAALGASRSPTTAIVRLAGTALQIAPARFQAALSRSGPLRHMIQTHTQALLAQFQNVAACNALHSVEARTARWLLQSHDRAEGDSLQLTQEILSELLGVRRTTVTHIVQKLRSSGAIRCNRRGTIEVDRPVLEVSACECYKAMCRRIDRIVPPDATKPRLQAATVNPQFRRTDGEQARSH